MNPLQGSRISRALQSFYNRHTEGNEHVLDQDVKTRWRSTFKTCKVLHENQAPVMFYDVRNGRNAGDTYKSNKLNV